MPSNDNAIHCATILLKQGNDQYDNIKIRETTRQDNSLEKAKSSS